jgi:diguanylate cyclase (GGDEF)-like protein
VNPENSLRDSLTGAHSRALLHDRLREEVERARRYELPLSLFVIDLDHFKSINDAFGHARGDMILRDFVERTRSLTRESDLLFRYGGDEFVLLLLHTDRHQANASARRLLEGTRATPFPGNPPLVVTLSIGSASFPQDGDRAEDLFERADRRLYAAKRQGRSRWVADDPLLPPGKLLFDAEARLPEREQPLGALRRFFDDLADNKRGTFSAHGNMGAGKSWFMREAVKAARLRGYVVWSLQGRPALRQRVYGVLAEAVAPMEGLPPPSAGTAAMSAALSRYLADEGKLGVVLVVDNLGEVDRASQDLLRSLLYASEIAIAALVYSEETGRPHTPLIESPLNVRVDLPPLEQAGVRLWLRSVLRWEAPDDFGDWLHQETGGLPGALQAGLRYLVDQRVLQPAESGWLLAESYRRVPLSRVVQAHKRPPPHNLPPAASGFVGREVELSELKRRLEEDSLLTIVAAGGMGKTRLAVQAAAEMVECFRHGVYFVSLTSVTRQEALISAIADTLKLTFSGSQNARAQLLQHLSNKQMLLLLDDGTKLVDGADLIADILQQAPRMKLLVTTRERLGLPGESVYELRGLAIPPVLEDGSQMALPLEPYSAEQLFVQSARRAAPDFNLTPEDRRYVRHICQLVDGLPLGIELAAAWTPLFSCREIASQIERNIDFLSTTDSHIPKRQRSARAVLDYFWSMLSDDERRRLRAMSIFSGGFGREAAAAVCDASLFFLAALVDKAFLRKLPSGRYMMHELLRQYAADKLHEDPGEVAQVRRLHAGYYALFLQLSLGPLKGGEQATALATISADIGNVRAAWQWATNCRETPLVRQSLECLVLFYEAQSWYHEGAEAFTKALESWTAASESDSDRDGVSTLGQLRIGQAVFLHRLGHNAQAQQLFEAGLADMRHGLFGPEHQAAVAFALSYLGMVMLDLGQYTEARQHLQQCLQLQREIGDQHGVAQALSHLASVAYDLGEFASARRLHHESLELRQAIGDQHGASFSLCSAGEVAIDLGEYVEAQELLKAAADMAQAAGNQRARVLVLRSLGRLSDARGEYALARHYYEESLSFNQATGNQKEVALDHFGLARAALHMAEYEEAHQVLEECAELMELTGYRRGHAMAQLCQGEMDATRKVAGAGGSHFLAALETAYEMRALPLVLSALVGLAGAWIANGERERSTEVLTMALFHHASNRATQDQAARLLSRLETEMPAALVAQAEERGRHLQLDRVVAGLLDRSSATQVLQ